MDSLLEKYPQLFKNATNRYSPMVFGIECGPGWRSIIESVCRLLEGKDVVFDQVKEKYGSLRIYWSGPDDGFVEGVIAMAEEMSRQTCDRCGNRGSTRGTGWLVTTCDECEAKK